MKKEIRIIGIDDGPFNKFKEKEVLVIGTIFRGGEWLDGVLSTKIKIGNNWLVFVSGMSKKIL